MKVKAYGNTDVGLKRSINQDTILIDPALKLYIVADGMGGHKGGEVASAIAVESAKKVVARELEKAEISARDIIGRAYYEASHNIFNESLNVQPELAGMGTTMVLALFLQDTLYIGNVGDSRAYLFSDNKQWQITEDHSLINEQLRAGVIKEEDIPSMTGKNVITRSVGFEKDVSADIIERRVRPGERVLLCSDGLSGLVSDVIIRTLCSNYSGQELVDRSIEEAKKAGGDDNISVIYIHFDE